MGGLEDRLRDLIQATTDWLATMLPAHLTWMTGPAERTMEYALGPLIDRGGRFPWWGLAAGLAIATLVYFVEQRRADSGHRDGLLRFWFPREIYRNKSVWVDLKVGFVNSVLIGNAVNVTWRLSAALFTSWITWALTATFGAVDHPATWGPLSIVLFMIALSMAADFGYFLFHWLAHVFPPLWAIHKVHHSAEVLTPLTAARVHALERPVMGLFSSVTTGVLTGPLFYLHGGETSVPTIFGLNMAAVAFFMLGHVLHHSHVWVYFGPVIGRVIVSPAQHQIHHSSLPEHLDKNFAEHWAIWDTIFGTLYLPKGREVLKLGLAGYQVQPHPGVVTANIRPVVESVSAIAAMGKQGAGWFRQWRHRNDGLPVASTADPSTARGEGFGAAPRAGTLV